MLRCLTCLTENPPGFKFCRQCGTPLTTPPEDERRLITVLFAEIAGFAAISEQLPPERAGELIDTTYSGLDLVVATYDGTIDKYMGDTVMVLFGAPRAHEDDPARALRCALGMLGWVADYNARNAHLLSRPLAMKIGVNTGLVVAGRFGADSLGRAYSVMGDAVNLAARLQGMAQRNEVLVGESSYQQARVQFVWHELGSTPVRGKAQAVSVYRLVAAEQETGTGRGLPGLYSSVIGRELETTALAEAVADLRGGRGRMVALFSEAGLGKSRLLDEATAVAAIGDPAIPTLFGRCLNYGAQREYQPWQDVIRRLLAISSSDGALAQFEAGATRLGLSEGQAAAISQMLGVAAEAGPRSPDEQATEDAAAVAALLRAATASRPLLVALEDLHWADQPTLAMLPLLLPQLAGLPLLFVCTSRPYGAAAERIRALATSLPMQSFDLQPLTDGEVDGLLCNLLATNALPAQVSAIMLARAAGNPFYVEEFIRTLIERGWMIAEEGGWRFMAGEMMLEVPPTLQGMIAARIDSLPPGPRRALQVASVLGRSFQPDVLAALDEAAAQAHNLVLLVERAVLLPEDDGRYAFRHTLTQEVAYNTLLIERRRQYHAAAAKHYSAQPLLDPPRAVGDLEPLLEAAYHYSIAGEFQAAYELINRVVDSKEQMPFSRRMFLWGGAATMVEILNRLAAPNSLAAITAVAQAEVLSILGLAYYYLGNSTLAAHYSNLAVPIAEATNYSGLGSIYNRLGVIYATLGDLRKAVGYYEQALAAAERNEDVQIVARSLVNLGLAHLKLGEMRSAKEYTERALVYSEQSGDLDNQSALLNNLGVQNVALGYLQVAIGYHKRSVEIAEQVGNYVGKIEALNDIGVAYRDQGNIEDAIAVHQQALTAAESSSDSGIRVSVLTLLGTDYTAQGEYELALAYHRQALNTLDNIKDPFERGEILGGTGRTYLAMGDYKMAKNYHKQALQCFFQIGDLIRQASTMNSLAADYNSLGRPNAALGYAVNALQLAKKVEAPLVTASAHYELGLTQQSLGNLAAARSAYEASIALRTKYQDRRLKNSEAALASLTTEGNQAASK